MDPLLVIGYDPEWFQQNYDVVREFEPIVGSEIVTSREAGEPLFYCAGLRAPAADLWAALRHFD